MKALAMIAHDQQKRALCDWVKAHQAYFLERPIVATGTTAKLIKAENPALDITGVKSGPLGGDQQIGALIAEGKIEVVFFFQDPMTAQPHDVDVKALVRLATVYDVPIACNESTANYIISSPYFMHPEQAPQPKSVEERYGSYLKRVVQQVVPQEK
ncbi:methylglyoxal synthase [Thiofilum flexile]|uniref:methylglyoxal synthase n=1 Tax=Thiofilum flexile TaxID=125627 RepID=UPI0003629E5D|nr:methylglyoxal synthase [Thiofilum flexile]